MTFSHYSDSFVQRDPERGNTPWLGEYSSVQSREHGDSNSYPAVSGRASLSPELQLLRNYFNASIELFTYNNFHLFLVIAAVFKPNSGISILSTNPRYSLITF